MPQIDSLADRLGLEAQQLAGLAGCDGAGLDQLLALVDAALAREQQEIDAGLRATLKAVPRPLRGRAKTLLFGEDPR